MTTHTFENSFTTQTFERRMCRILAVTFGVLCLLYAYGIISTVSLVLERRGAENQAKELLAELSVTEAQYLSRVGEITPDHALSLGFKPLNVQYVKVRTGIQNVSFNTTDR